MQASWLIDFCGFDSEVVASILGLNGQLFVGKHIVVTESCLVSWLCWSHISVSVRETAILVNLSLLMDILSYLVVI